MLLWRCNKKRAIKFACFVFKVRRQLSKSLVIENAYSCQIKYANFISDLFLSCTKCNPWKIYNLLLSLLVVALSEEIGHRNDDAVPTEKCLKVINNFIKGTQIEESDIKYKTLNDFDIEKTPLSW